MGSSLVPNSFSESLEYLDTLVLCLTKGGSYYREIEPFNTEFPATESSFEGDSTLES